MIKTQYQKEIVISTTCAKGNPNNKKQDVLKIQSWLNLYAHVNPSAATATGIDGDFGGATDIAVRNFQKANSLAQTGIVDQQLFSTMCLPMTEAFSEQQGASPIREKIVAVANRHLNRHAFELNIKGENNSGPWVRAYMDGYEGEEWFWCMGFVQSMIDQALSAEGRSFKKFMPLTYSCDTLGTLGTERKLLIRSEELRKDPSLVKPGDIFLLQKSPNDWFHTGLVTGVMDDIFETIEGNTNTDGSHNGNGVYKRLRNFRQSKLDVFSIREM